MAHDTERLLRVTLPPAIELHMHLPTGLPPVLADATQVEQALLNLCTNAIHAIQSAQSTQSASNAKGSIHVEAVALQPDQRLCERLGLGADGGQGLTVADYVALSVRDNGPGMDAATLQRIFEPFFTTKPVGQGTGLGLAVVHGVMRTHEGAVDVQSTPGEGSRFTLYFPVAQPEQAAKPALPASLSGPTAPEQAPVPGPAPDPSPANAEAPRPHHVMYVDDDEALVFLVQRLLRRRGYRVSGFTDPHEATAALRAQPHEYDLLVTDYNMPGFCGVDLVREARLIRPDLPVALASGYVTAEIEQAALAEGARALIHKPNDVEELCATVHQLVHGDDANPR